MDAKLFSGTTVCQKDIVLKNKPVWELGQKYVSFGYMLRLHPYPRSTLACGTFFHGFFPLLLIQEQQVFSN